MKNFSAQLQKILDSALDIVFPPRCIVSGEQVERQSMVAPKIWSKLDFITDPYCQSCGLPFDFEVEENDQTGRAQAYCTDCLDCSPAFQTARAALIYNDASRDIILGFKHADKMHAVLAFLPWLQRAGTDMLKNCDVIVPVPLHPFRLVKRRYNQAAILAQYLGKETGHDVLVSALQRVRATQSQGHLDTRERAKNVKKAFTVNSKYINALRDKNIVLIDDVYTTGFTAKECTETLLKQAKVARVDVLCVARAVKK